LAIAKELRQGKVFPELIAADANGSLILIEGHSRATAYALESTEDVQTIVATSPSMDRWAYV
jgi:hypothetical protein